MKMTLLLTLTMMSLNSMALECTNFSGKKLSKASSQENWILTIEGKEPVELSGSSYLFDGFSIAYNLTDENENSYHLVKKVTSGYSHCRSRYCPSAPTPQTKKLLLSTNGSDNEHFNCL